MAAQDTLVRARHERDRAEALLRHLLTAKADSERNLASSNERDPMKSVTGRSSFDNAIASTRRLIEMLDRTCAEVARPTPSVSVRQPLVAQAMMNQPLVGALVGPVA